MNATAAGGDWPRGGTFDWTPLAMNAPAQHRPGVLPLAAGKRIVLASQDGYAYCADAGAGGSHPGTVWVSNDGTLPLQLGTMLQAGPTGMYADFVPGAVNRTFVGTRNATAANQVSALDPADGHEVYAFTDSSAQNGDGLGIGIVTGLTVDYATSLLYFTSRGWGGGSSNTVWCVSMGASTATRVWAVNKGDIDGSPVLHNGRLYVGTNAGWVYALDPADGSEVWSYNAANGPVKGYVYPHFGSTPLKLYFSTTDKIWALQENGTSTPTKLWEVTAVPSPSTPLLLASANLLLAGGNDGRLYQFDVNSPGTTLTSRLLGTGTIGSPGLDGVNNLALAGSSAGVVYAVSVPLS
jgi:outer membrane protein assembly factor BamB